ncbi:unnamed protein product [Rotaria sp. Silwood2]|nr:unnamed protein product [Rotaria sp. Silwood2]CAF4440436.1 unnamed protein product [Rotaria sp. Silwood2]
MDVAQSIFVLASISKTFIAVSVMQLVESNRLDLDTDINQYLSSPNQRISHPQYPCHPITLRQLLSHSASIGSNLEMEMAFGGFGDDGFSKMSLADACFTYLNHNASNWLPRQPGTVRLYSNVGTSLAALVVERVTQMPHEHYVREKILKLLGIDVKKAGFRLSDLDNRQQLAKHYVFNASYLDQWTLLAAILNVTKDDVPIWLEVPFNSISIYPSSMMRMSARSLSIFLRMFMSNGSPLLHPRFIIEMRTIVVGVDPYENENSSGNDSSVPTLEFGLIWNWQTIKDGRRFIGHTGVSLGATNSMLVNEQGNVGVIVLTNGNKSLDNNRSNKVEETIQQIQLMLFDCFTS